MGATRVAFHEYPLLPPRLLGDRQRRPLSPTSRPAPACVGRAWRAAAPLAPLASALVFSRRLLVRPCRLFVSKKTVLPKKRLWHTLRRVSQPPELALLRPTAQRPGRRTDGPRRSVGGGASAAAGERRRHAGGSQGDCERTDEAAAPGGWGGSPPRAARQPDPSARGVLDTYTGAIFRDMWRYVAICGDT